MQNKVYTIGFLGYGGVARNQMRPAVQACNRLNLYAIASASQHEIQDFSGILYHDYQSLLDDPQVDIVYIALPNTHHARYVLECLERGKHVICEKPLAMKEAEVEAIIEASQRTGCRVMEGFMYRYMDRMKLLQKLLGHKVIGQVRQIQSSFFSLRERLRGIRANPALGGGSLWDLGCYPISLISFLIPDEMPNIVQATARRVLEVDGYMAGQLGYSSGILASFSCGWISEVRTIETRLIGTEGVVEIQRLFNWERGSIRVLTKDKDELMPLEAEDPFLKELEAFIIHLETNSDLLMPLEESKRIISLMNQIETSIVWL